MEPVKHSVRVHGHRTSLSLEPEFWQALQAVAQARNRSISALIADIDTARLNGPEPRNLSSAVRVYLLDYFRELMNE